MHVLKIDSVGDATGFVLKGGGSRGFRKCRICFGALCETVGIGRDVDDRDSRGRAGMDRA